MTRAAIVFAGWALSTSVAFADSVAIRDGTDPTAAQLGHVFMSVCEPGNPFLMERDFALLGDAFRWTPTEGETDLSYISPTGAIAASFDSNYAGATCTLTIPSAISGDGTDIYEGLDAHLQDAFEDELPAATAIDGGLQWEWVETGTVDITHNVAFIENAEGHILRTTSTSF